MDSASEVQVHYVLVRPQGFLQAMSTCRWEMPDGWDKWGATGADHRGDGYLLEIPIEVRVYRCLSPGGLEASVG